MVLEAALVPHQLLVALTSAPGLVVKRLLPPAVAEFPAKRLKLITKWLPVALLSTLMPPPPPGLAPPLPVALFPVIVTLVSVVVSPVGNPVEVARLFHNPAPSCAVLLLITVPWSIVMPAVVRIPPPRTRALFPFPEIVPP